MTTELVPWEVPVIGYRVWARMNMASMSVSYGGWTWVAEDYPTLEQANTAKVAKQALGAAVRQVYVELREAATIAELYDRVARSVLP